MPLTPQRTALAALLLALCLAAPHAFAQYEDVVNAWTTQDQASPPPDHAVVFIGSSSIRRWEQLSRDFADYDVIQRGYGGSHIEHAVAFADRIVTPYHPAAVVMFAGTNDVKAGKSAQTVYDDYLSFVAAVRRGQSPGTPDIPIFFIALTPAPSRAANWPIAAQVNDMIQAHAATDPSLYYIDTAQPFLDAGAPGPTTPNYFVGDRLHLNQLGYDLWTGVIHPFLNEHLPPTKRFTPDATNLKPGDRVRFDFGPTNPDTNNHAWNNWYPVDADVTIHPGQRLNHLVNDRGQPTSVNLVITGGFKAGSATGNSFYCAGNGSDRPGGLMLSGLDPTLHYNLKLFASRPGDDTRVTTYTLTGADTHTTSLTVSNNTDAFAVFTGVQPDRFGQLFLDVDKAGDADAAYLAALELVATE